MNGGPERPSYEPGRVWSAGFNVFGGLVVAQFKF